MKIKCTHCGTRFLIADEKVRPEGTKVRCSRCTKVFLAVPETAGERSGPVAGPSAGEALRDSLAASTEFMEEFPLEEEIRKSAQVIPAGEEDDGLDIEDNTVEQPYSGAVHPAMRGRTSDQPQPAGGDPASSPAPRFVPEYLTPRTAKREKAAGPTSGRRAELAGTMAQIALALALLLSVLVLFAMFKQGEEFCFRDLTLGNLFEILFGKG